jgi:FtsZ-interacting cell division protein ZipA
MDSRGLLIVAVVAIAILLVGSTAFSHSAEAQKSEYKAKVKVRLDSTCWDKVDFEVNDGVGGNTLAKKTVNNDNQRDDSISTTLKFNGKKVHSGQIQLYISNEDSAASAYDYTTFKKSKHTYNFFNFELPADRCKMLD